MTRCNHCPRAGEPFCLGSRSPIVCRRRDPDDPMRDETFDSPLAGEDEATEIESLEVSPVTYSVPLAINLAVLQCPHRTKLPACGCAGRWRCERDGADVAWGGCVACKTAEAAEDAPSPS